MLHKQIPKLECFSIYSNLLSLYINNEELRKKQFKDNYDTHKHVLLNKLKKES